LVTMVSEDGGGRSHQSNLHAFPQEEMGITG
jgi:hypothetical protein